MIANLKRTIYLDRFSRWINQGFNSYLLLLLPLFLVYFFPAHVPYFFADETSYFNAYWNSPIFSADFWTKALYQGRPITIYLLGIMAKIVNSGDYGLLVIRIFQLFISSFCAWIFFLLLRRKLSNYFSYILVLLVWYQPAFSVYHTYSMLTPYLFGILFSYLAFYLVCCANNKNNAAILGRIAGATALLIASFMIFQAAPYAAIGLACIYVLTTPNSSWNNGKKYWTFLTLISITTIVYVFGYKWLLDANQDSDAYIITFQVFDMLSSSFLDNIGAFFTVDNYRGVFEWWNYIVPIPKFSDAVYRQITSAFLSGWATAIIISFYLEVATNAKRVAIQKYFFILLSLLLTLFPIYAEGGTGRQHVYIATVPAVILTGGYALVHIFNFLTGSTWVLKRAAVAAVIFLGLGAQAQIYRSIIHPSVRYLNFTKQEMIRQYENNVTNVYIIKTSQHCYTEPCRGLMSRHLGTANRDIPEFYAYVLKKISGNNDIPIVFSYEDLSDTGSIVIDYRILEAQLRLNAP